MPLDSRAPLKQSRSIVKCDETLIQSATGGPMKSWRSLYNSSVQCYQMWRIVVQCNTNSECTLAVTWLKPWALSRLCVLPEACTINVLAAGFFENFQQLLKTFLKVLNSLGLSVLPARCTINVLLC